MNIALWNPRGAQARERTHIAGTVKRPKFGNGPLVRHPQSEILKNHISVGIEVSNLVQKA